MENNEQKIKMIVTAIDNETKRVKIIKAQTEHGIDNDSFIE